MHYMLIEWDCQLLNKHFLFLQQMDVMDGQDI